MQHRKRLAGCLIAMCAVGAAGASAASAALPEFASGSPPGFESILGKTKLETVGKTLVMCKHGGNGGEVTGPKTLTVRVTLVECSIPGALCTSPGAELGDIVTASLDGSLGYIHTPKKVGLDLSSPSGPITTFSCGAATFVVEGSVIGKITPLNKLQAPGEHFTLKFAQKKGKQMPPSLQGAPIDVLETSINGKPFEQSGFATKDELFFVAPLEIKA